VAYFVITVIKNYLPKRASASLRSCAESPADEFCVAFLTGDFALVFGVTGSEITSSESISIV
jgi:hypothetical protein